MNTITADALETTLHCSAEYHLARLRSRVAPLIYSLAMRVSKGSGLFFPSLETLAPYLNISYGTAVRAMKELVDGGFFKVESKETFKATVYRVIKHEDWAVDHPGTCCAKISFPWSDEPKDPLGVAMYEASGSRRKFFPGELKALRDTSLDDQTLVYLWKRFLEADKPVGKQWKGSFYRFLKLLRLNQREAARYIPTTVDHG